jgi:voltage-dependent calcium channel
MYTSFVSIVLVLIGVYHRASLPVILSLLLLWFALFLFFGILFVEVFGLTRWESAETPDQNYTSLGRALVMLAFMSTGYEFNPYACDLFHFIT